MSSSIYTNVLSSEELNYLNNRPEVFAAKNELDSKESGMVYFSVPITSSIRDTLQSQFGLQIYTSQIPMRWIKGDTAPHIDVGSSNFQTTYLLYLNDSPGELIIDSHTYPIQTNTGFVFNEGLSHESKYTENVPRLLLGPMNELAEPVGQPPGIYYFYTETDALNMYPTIGYGGYQEYTVGQNQTIPNLITPYSSWRIASSSSGSSSQSGVYTNGNVLNSDGDSAYYYLYPSATCFLEGTTVLSKIDGVETYVPIELLKAGTLVKTSLDGYNPISFIGKGTIKNPGNNERTENRLYKCSTSKYPQLTSDLYITGCHSILETSITETQKENIMKHLGKIFITDKKYRVMAHIDERAEPWNSEGEYTIWHFAIESHDERRNYGVYVNGGLIAETCSIHFLKNKSNMKLTSGH
jgi:hypothetical protein